MKMTKCIVFVLLCMGLPSLLSAQPPGYLGKRFNVSLGLSSFPAIGGVSANGRRGFTNDFNSAFNTEKNWGLNYELEGKLNYVVGRYRALGLSFGLYRTGMISSLRTPSLGTNGDDFHDLLSRVKVRSVGVTSSKFNSRKGGLAPLGNQFIWGFKRIFVSGEIMDQQTEFASDLVGETLGHGPLGVDNVKGAYTSILLGWSNTQIFYDKLMVSVGGRFTLPLSPKVYDALADQVGNDPRYLRIFDTEEEENQHRNSIRYEYEIYNRVALHELFRIDVSVGLLF